MTQDGYTWRVMNLTPYCYLLGGCKWFASVRLCCLLCTKDAKVISEYERLLYYLFNIYDPRILCCKNYMNKTLIVNWCHFYFMVEKYTQKQATDIIHIFI